MNAVESLKLRGFKEGQQHSLESDSPVHGIVDNLVLAHGPRDNLAKYNCIERRKSDIRRVPGRKMSLPESFSPLITMNKCF